MHSFASGESVKITVWEVSRTGVITDSDARWIVVDGRRFFFIEPRAWPELPLWRMADGKDCTVELVLNSAADSRNAAA